MIYHLIFNGIFHAVARSLCWCTSITKEVHVKIVVLSVLQFFTNVYYTRSNIFSITYFLSTRTKSFLFSNAFVVFTVWIFFVKKCLQSLRNSSFFPPFTDTYNWSNVSMVRNNIVFSITVSSYSHKKHCKTVQTQPICWPSWRTITLILFGVQK